MEIGVQALCRRCSHCRGSSRQRASLSPTSLIWDGAPPVSVLQACRAAWTPRPTPCCRAPCAPAATQTCSTPSRWVGDRLIDACRAHVCSSLLVAFSATPSRRGLRTALLLPPQPLRLHRLNRRRSSCCCCRCTMSSRCSLHLCCRTRAPAPRPSPCLARWAAAPTSPPSTLKQRWGRRRDGSGKEHGASCYAVPSLAVPSVLQASPRSPPPCPLPVPPPPASAAPPLLQPRHW